MAWTAPTTRTTGELITASIWNADLTDNLAYLGDLQWRGTNFSALGATYDLGTYQGARVYHSANQSLSSGSATPLSFDSERFDTDAYHDTSTNNSRITIPANMGGKYLITGHVAFAADATGYREINVFLNGTTDIANHRTSALSGVSTIMSVATVYSLAATDYVELRAFQNSGGALNASAIGNLSPEFTATWLGV